MLHLMRAKILLCFQTLLIFYFLLKLLISLNLPGRISDTCPKNDVILFSRKGFGPLG